MVPPRNSGGRLTADDWIDAGFAALAEGGPNALRVDRLSERLHVTKGSFYWHFSDTAAYRRELIKAWGALRDRNRRKFEQMPDVDPRDRLRVMIQTWVAPDQWQLERAMRVWALTDDEVLASVQESDARVLRAIRRAFVDCGFDRDDAALRAFVVFSAGVGLLHSTDSAPAAPPGLQESFLHFMLRP
ncbi:TetR/AcrR family transcriptional regulator [Mycobacterium sp. 3519A]|jgi:AcrR family transcriptional regulator|uniref:TetR/AcrR family transcriptional regulator n=1 Tax=Mycobacterium sp. 3519A TaxID=2057184 RepID=UPI000C79EA61|nr:TetR/AcrR family transcriptional regulator [Mycobacterium sp. 3519A]